MEAIVEAVMESIVEAAIESVTVEATAVPRGIVGAVKRMPVSIGDR